MRQSHLEMLKTLSLSRICGFQDLWTAFALLMVFKQWLQTLVVHEQHDIPLKHIVQTMSPKTKLQATEIGLDTPQQTHHF
jgi:hypothetical protein